MSEADKRQKKLGEEAKCLFHLWINAHCALLNPKNLDLKKFFRSAGDAQAAGPRLSCWLSGDAASLANALRGGVEGRTRSFWF